MSENQTSTGERSVQTLNFCFAVVFCLLGSLLPYISSWFNPGACILGSTYTILNTRFLYFMVGSLEKGHASKAIAVLGGLAKLPILFALVYLAYSQGLSVLWSSLIGVFIFVPTSIAYAVSIRKQS